MSRQSFVKTVEQLFKENAVDPQVKEYFTQNFFKSTRKSSADLERAEAIKSSILEVVRGADKLMDRNEIGRKIEALMAEGTLRNEKGEIAFNSVTAYANQLVEQGLLEKKEVRERKSKRVKYQAVSQLQSVYTGQIFNFTPGFLDEVELEAASN
jgi:hypothetical protein